MSAPGASAVPARATLGLYALIALVVGNMIGSGTFLLPAALAPYGLAALAGWALSLGGALALALVFARLALRLPGGGGPHHYARQVFGDHAGFVVAWCYWVSSWCGVAAIAIAFAGNLAAVFPGVQLNPQRAALVSTLAILFCTALNQLGLRAGSGLQNLTAVLKLLPLLGIGLLGWFWFDPGIAIPAAAAEASPGTNAAPWWTTLHAVAALTLWAFLGLECATVPADSVRDPARNVPRATVIGTLLAGLASVLACTVVLGLVPSGELAQSTAPLALAAERTWGGGAGTWMAAAAAIACFGAVNGWVLVQAQVAAAAGRDRLFPAAFASAGAHAPTLSLWLGGSLAVLLVLANSRAQLVSLYTFAVLLSTAACLLPFLICALAALWRAQSRAQVVIALTAAAFSLWALYGTGWEALGWGLVLVLAGLPIWLWTASRRSR